MKKHSLIEHLNSFWKWYDAEYARAGSPPISFDSKTVEMTAWWTAYERWLNDRPLLTEEHQVEAE